MPLIPTCIYPRKSEVCCDSLTGASSSQRPNDDLAILREHGVLGTVDGYNEWLANQQRLSWPYGEWCIKWGKSQVLHMEPPTN